MQRAVDSQPSVQREELPEEDESAQTYMQRQRAGEEEEETPAE